jgi:serine phosphatase RsbU (regulator of sigma subunit)
MWLIEDLAGRIAVVLDNARLYARMRKGVRALQRGLLPYDLPDIPGVERSVVFEPAGEGVEVGGDFYDVFAAGRDRWRFALGDVSGHGLEAAAVTGLARHAMRLLVGEGHGVGAVIDRLNRAILNEGERGRMTTLLHGELQPLSAGGARVTLVSAGHPPPLRLRPDGEVTAVTRPQLLLGAMDGDGYKEDVVRLDPGDALVCVTDGVTERRNGDRLLDDDDGLARMLSGWTGLPAAAITRRLHQAVATYAPTSLDDDLAILVLRVRP